MTFTRPTHYDAAPIRRAIRHGANHRQLGELLHVDRRTIQRWLETGIPGHWTADRVALALDSHPAIEWPDLWTSAA